MKEFTRSGIRVQLPDDWTIEEEDSENGWTVSLFSPDSAFLLLSLIDDNNDPHVVAAETMDSLLQEYPELESETVVVPIAGQPAVGHDIQFFLYDLTNTIWTRCLAAGGGCLMLLAQLTDAEMETHGDTLKQMMNSIQIED